ncbi:hypothetical protein [Spiroplasma melliferum]|uniref:Molecular chaperone DnaJ n=2 Tax=Spiroplasma melliferum TaxID=2134 RepID=A0AAI9T353_SPIME|nr:hypothetical protein [Spiroplasma melliferum]ELL44121.1 DnaJ domain-containing protein [Spiroplasma melliferum IPMB4A]KAI92465.1 molecular chaperone DnaJ [Spiroplasma melliferum KC3]QCO23915.1 hypothetical protein SRED_002395 [Spiroplasma melliferum]
MSWWIYLIIILGTMLVSFFLERWFSTKSFYKNKNEEETYIEDDYEDDYSDYFTEWEIEEADWGYWTINQLTDYTNELRTNNSEAIDFDYSGSNEYNIKKTFQVLNYYDDYKKYIFNSQLLKLEKELNKKYDAILTQIIIVALLKFNYYAALSTNNLLYFLFEEDIKVDSSFENFINKTNKLVSDYLGYITTGILEEIDLTEQLDSYNNHNQIEDLLDFGSNFINDWFEEMITLIHELGLNFDDDEDYTFEQNNVEEALNYFSLTKDDTYHSFKKKYRWFSTKYHPDANPSHKKFAETEMQKINGFKDILEEYFRNKKT